MTKLELQQKNTQLATENAALRMRVAQLEGDIERITSVASAMNTIDRLRPAMPQWQVDRAKCMAAARSQAMAMGCVVKA